jgi:hypothetical protein
MIQSRHKEHGVKKSSQSKLKFSCGEIKIKKSIRL